MFTVEKRQNNYYYCFNVRPSVVDRSPKAVGVVGLPTTSSRQKKQLLAHPNPRKRQV